VIGKRFGYHCFCALRCFFPRKKSASRSCKFYRGLFAGDLPSAARRRLTRGGALANQVLQVYGLGAAGRCRLAFQSLTGDRSGSDRPHSDGQGRLRSAHGSGVLAKNGKKDGGKETPPEFLSTIQVMRPASNSCAIFCPRRSAASPIWATARSRKLLTITGAADRGRKPPPITAAS
jgi:hypothetical protein